MGNKNKTKSPTLKIEHRGEVYLTSDLCRITGYSQEQIRIHMHRVLCGKMSMSALLRLRKKQRLSFQHKEKTYEALDICEITGYAIDWASKHVRKVLNSEMKAGELLKKRKLDQMYKQCPKWRGLCAHVDVARKKLFDELQEQFKPSAAAMDKYFPPEVR